MISNIELDKKNIFESTCSNGTDSITVAGRATKINQTAASDSAMAALEKSQNDNHESLPAELQKSSKDKPNQSQVDNNDPNTSDHEISDHRSGERSAKEDVEMTENRSDLSISKSEGVEDNVTEEMVSEFLNDLKNHFTLKNSIDDYDFIVNTFANFTDDW